MPDEIAYEFEYNGFRFFFRKRNYDSHAKKHSELRHPSIFPRIRKAITDPVFVYPDYLTDGQRHCCYYKEFEIGQLTRYTKVVIVKNLKNSYEIVSVFRPTNVKEVKYNIYPLDLSSLEWL